MTRLTILLLIGFLAAMVSCAKPPGFKTEDYEFKRVESSDSKSRQDSKQTVEEGTVVRNSSRIEFTPVHSDWQQEELTLTANVKVGDNKYEKVEFRGTKVDSKILLTPTKPELSEKLKAQVICTSEAGCEDFFVDVFYQENKVLYHDQVLATPKEEIPETNKPTPTAAVPSPTVKDEFVIQDEVPQEAIESTGYVGTSDSEALKAFEIRPAKKEEPQPAPRTSTPQPARPAEPKTAPETSNPRDTEKERTAPELATGAKQQSPSASSTSLERYRLRDQVIGRPDEGRLTRATDFMKLSSLPGMFFVMKPGEKNYFGMFDVGLVLQELGKYLQTVLPGRKLTITEISSVNGGPLRYRVGRRTFLHASHQNGQDVDIRYLRHDENQPSDIVDKGILSKNFLPAEQWGLFKKAFATNKVELIFVDAVIKKAMCEEAKRTNDYRNGQSGGAAEILRRLYVVPGHDHHFHIRVRCGDDQPQCRRIRYKQVSVGC